MGVRMTDKELTWENDYDHEYWKRESKTAKELANDSNDAQPVYNFNERHFDYIKELK